MTKTIKLTKSYTIDDKKFKEFIFDTDKATQNTAIFAMHESAKMNSGAFLSIEVDNAYHLALGKKIVADSNDLVYEDLNDLSFADCMRIMLEARGFLFQSLGFGDEQAEQEKEKSREKNISKKEAEI